MVKMYIILYFLCVVLCSIFYFFVHYKFSYAFLHVHTGTHVVIERLNHHVLFSCMLVDLNIWCVYVESLLNIMYFVAYVVVSFHSHLHLFSFNINTNIHVQ